MSLLKSLTLLLQDRPNLPSIAEVDGGIRLSAPDPDGFEVVVHCDEEFSSPTMWTIFLGNSGFHTHLYDLSEAAHFVVWCFSGRARVVETCRGQMVTSAKLEALEEGRWTLEESWGLIFFPFWRRKTIKVRRN